MDDRPWKELTGFKCPAPVGVFVDIKFTYKGIEEIVLNLPTFTFFQGFTLGGVLFNCDNTGIWRHAYLAPNDTIKSFYFPDAAVINVTHWRLSAEDQAKRDRFIALAMDPVKFHVSDAEDYDIYNDPPRLAIKRTPTEWRNKPKPDGEEPFYGM